MTVGGLTCVNFCVLMSIGCGGFVERGFSAEVEVLLSFCNLLLNPFCILYMRSCLMVVADILG